MVRIKDLISACMNQIYKKNCTVMTTSRILVILLVSLVVKNEASRILAVFPAASLSHQLVFRPLVLELVKRGHEVVVLNTDPMFKKGEGPANLTEIDVHELSYRIVRQEFLQTTMTQGSKNDVFKQWETGFKIMLKVFEAQFSTDAMQELLKDKTKSFDLLILEAVFPSLLGLTSIYNASVIQISSFGSTNDNLRTVGASTHPLVYPIFIQQRAHTLTLWDKITELYTYFWINDLVATYEKDSEEAMKRMFGSDLPSMTELKNKVDMLFLNIHPIWESNRPVPPNVIYMGGLHQKPEKELPQDLKEYLDSSKHGVIYVSFGTNVEPAMLPPQKIQTLIGAFTKTPYDILWKWNTDYELPGKAKNIKLSKWLPQADLLRHPKIKLFITQGGLQSTDEAITAGVPLIGIPMLADQWFNVDQYVHLKIGLGIDMETISEEILGAAIKTIISNESYRVNMARIRSIMQDQPQTPLERATWWVEYVLRHGGAKHLRSPAANMQWTEYLELELISYLILGLLSVLAILGYVIYFLHHLCFANQRTKRKLKEN